MIRTLTLLSTLLCGLDAIAISALVEARNQCGSTLGSCMAQVVGGRPPYTFSWSNGATTGTITGLVPGTYTVTVTDADGGVATASGVVAVQDPDQFLDWGLAGDAFCPEGAIQTPVARWSPQTTTVGPPPYYFNGNEVYPDGDDGFSSMYLIHIPTSPGSSMQMRFEDGNGCGGLIQATAGHPVQWPSVDIQHVWGACQGGANGGIRAEFGGGNGYPVAAEIRNAQNVVVIPGGDYWHGWGSVTHIFQGLPAGSYTLHQRLTAATYTGYYHGCFNITPFTIPDLGTTCGTVSGTVYMDTDEDCVMDAASSEPRVPQAILRFTPGPYYATTNSAGAYNVALPYGQYTVHQESTTVAQHCIATVNVTGNHVLNIGDTSLVGMDAEVRIYQGPARPGFEFQQSVVVRNRSPHPTGATITTFTFDPVLNLLEATPPPTTVNGNTLTWTQGTLAAFQSRSMTLRLQVPSDVGLLGTQLTASATLATANTDMVPENNMHTVAATITGSYDPNDKLATTSVGTGAVTGYAPAVDDFVDYTIRFQNTGTDTAFTVVITDTLPAGLEPTSIHMGAASHPFKWELHGRGVVTFKFEDILLPDSNVNEPRSHGFVGFRIRPKTGALDAPGDRVDNIANIYFDFNPPVITEPCVVQVPQPDVLLRAKVLLEGVAGAGDGLMNDALRSQGRLPLREPYTAMGYTHTGGGGEQVSPAVFSATGTDAIVDWVVVEVRPTTAPATVVRSTCALLQRDGDIVDLDGTSPLGIAVPPGNYRIVVRHRNHLGVMTANAVSLQHHVPAVVDFTSTTTITHGTNARALVNGRMCLWCGDGDGNGQVKYTGVGNDRDPILQRVGGSVPTNVVSGVYSPLDINLDGQLKYTGSDNDRDPILRTIGGTVPTATRSQQLP